jgi:serine/threonine protein kinase
MTSPTMVPCPTCGAPGPVDITNCLLCGAARHTSSSVPAPVIIPLDATAMTQPVDGTPVFVPPPVTGEVDEKALPPRTGKTTVNDAGASRESVLEPGTVILGKYRIVRTLGHGGMGTVYLAVDEVTTQQVAVKMLPPGLSREKGIRERFTQEAKALARLDHPSIVPLIGFATEGDSHFLIMKFIEGPTLDDTIEKGGPVEFSRAREIFRSIVDALGYAHQKGVIHRDVKPANVLLTNTGHLFLVDFGIAKGTESVKLTQTGMLMGTPQYMSPEQISGHPVDGRSDLYAAGLILFEMLTGRPPFNGERTYSILKAHVESPVPDPEKLRGALIPNDLLVVVKRLLEKDPADRPADAANTIALLGDSHATRPSFGTSEIPRDAVPPRLTTPPTTSIPDLREDELQSLAPPARGKLYAVLALTLVASIGTGSYVLGRNTAPELPDDVAAMSDDSPAGVAFVLEQAKKKLAEGNAPAAVVLLETLAEGRRHEPDVLLVTVDALVQAKRRTRARATFDDLQSRSDLTEEQRALSKTLELAIIALERSDGDRRRKKDGDAPNVEYRLPYVQLTAVTHGKRTETRLQECWEQVLKDTPDAKGNVKLEVRIKPSGKVVSVRVLNQDVGGPAFARCIERIANSWEFPAFLGQDEIILPEFAFEPPVPSGG